MAHKNKFDVRTINTSHLKVRDAGDGKMRIEGYALTFNQPSEPMPFIEYLTADSLDNVDLSNVLLLYNHDFANILARTDAATLTLTVDETGLFFSAILPDTTLGNDTYKNIVAGNLKGMSFGFKIADGGDTWSQNPSGQVIHKVNQISEISEISITSIPAYTETSVQVTRSLEKFKRKGAIRENMADEKEQKQATNPTGGNTSVSQAELVDLVKQLKAALSEQKPKDNPAPDPDEEDRAAKKKQQQGNGAMVPAGSTTGKKKAGSNQGNGAMVPAGGGTNKKSGGSKAQGNGAMIPAGGNKKQKRDDDDNITDDNTDAADVAEPTDVPNDTSDTSIPDNDDDKQRNLKKGDDKSMAHKIKGSGTDDQVRSFENFLKTKQITRDISGGVGLPEGSVIIPETILPSEHEKHQFPRLGNLVRTISVKSTTGKLPVFQTSDDVLELHDEFQSTDHHKAPEIKPVPWDLHTYTGAYVFSQELIQDSQYNWQSELQSRLRELQENTQDKLIIGALTDNITANTSENLIDDIKDALNEGLKPQDSQQASIILSQAAYAAIDKEKDTLGRGLLNPDPSQATGFRILGKQVVVIDDNLFPSAQTGDVNVLVTPLKKAVINFQQSQITGRFIDNFDVWYRELGIFLREDVEQARPDLIIYLKGSNGGTTTKK